MLDKELITKVQLVFGQSSDQILSRFEDYAKGEEWISHKKVLNAILKLSRGDISKIDKYLNMAKIDPRDIVMIVKLNKKLMKNVLLKFGLQHRRG